MAIAYLVGGLGLALGVPAFLVLTTRRLAGTLGQPELLLWQTLPYLVCGALWLPWGSDRAARAGRGLAGLLFAISLVLYVPVLLHPALLGGDMVGLGFILLSVALTVGALVISLIVGITWWVQSLRTGRGPRPPSA